MWQQRQIAPKPASGKSSAFYLLTLHPVYMQLHHGSWQGFHFAFITTVENKTSKYSTLKVSGFYVSATS